ncbi:MAG: YbaK/EbsC family protein [Acidobacteria bacterium]|nr:YbaK/EbsC family protein [Acidobacteriota bacterium]
MPIPANICKFLDSQRITYHSLTHARSFTAQGTAQAQHLSGRKLAKVVIVKVDNRQLIMAVVPANCRVDLDRLGNLLDMKSVRPATEEEFKDIFPDCELGAMPPLGNIYHLDVWVDEALKSCPTIAFNAGTHSEIIQMSFADFEQLVHPRIGSFGALLH